MRERAPDRHNDIPDDVKQMFEAVTLDLISRGWKKYSADAILHRIRWHMHVEKNQRAFKCNDHWTSHLSRWFADEHPDLAWFFNYRRLGGNHEDYSFFE